MKKFNKTIAKEFKSSFGRFIAIMAIIALGVGFLIGLTQATPDMQKSMHDYYEKTAAYDVNIKSAYGFTQEDVLALLDANNEAGQSLVEKLSAFISSDAPVVVTKRGKTQQRLIARVNGVNFAELNGANAVNRLELVEGRMPAADAPQEVVVQRSNHNFVDIRCGDTIRISGNGTLDGEGFSSVYTQNELTVVGVVSSPEYYYLDAREVTSLGSGVLGAVVYADSSVYQLENNPLYGPMGSGAVYTDVALILNNSSHKKVFYADYENYVKNSVTLFTKLGAERCEALNAKLESLAAVMPDLPRAEWYVLDIVSTNVSYIGFSMNADKVADIAGIFPVFFIVVAALVALTSMTRMVEEDRLQIGTFKALGYSNAKIMSKYMIYCCIASLVGSALGVLFGFGILPSIVWEAYRTLYYLPKLSLVFSPWFIVITLAITLGGTILVTLYAGYSSLKERPSQLMRPKAPKAGKRIFLEYCGFFWHRLKFSYKATLRNIFRYKRNMFMTIVSVMGCTALILVAFGINDSITAAIDTQYNDILNYEMRIEYSGIEPGGALEAFLQDRTLCADSYSLYCEDGHIEILSSAKNGTESVEVLSLNFDDIRFNSFVALRNSKKSAIMEVNQKGVVLSKNVATTYRVGAGDEIKLRRSGGESAVLQIAAVTENYMGSYLYIDSAYYTELFGEERENTLLVKTEIPASEYSALAENLLADSSVSGVSFTSDGKTAFEGLEKTMGFVIAVLVISAGALAAIVLYNLTNINIEERKKEIATLRVLGYKRREVAGYIYRESAVLTIVGALLGLGLGVLLHWFVVGRVSGVSMLLGRMLNPLSYVWSLGLTLLFAAVVYAFMLIKLNRIDMADSLKSNE